MPRLGTAGQSGSSPRVRGKLVRVLGRVALGRIIPARAGQTVALLSAANAPPDHPRACGANPPRMASANRGGGSSPRVRGKLHRFPLRSFRVRIIPARAGQTDAYRIDDYEHPDHPRACGANGQHHTTPGSATGSSPRVRGKLDPAHVYALYRRIIPARAGQTTLVRVVHALIPDHPRACGANDITHINGSTFIGSSPRVRGKHGRALVRRERAAGSSPRVRGKPPALVDKSGGLRIIPARAGQTFGSRS